MPEGEIRRACPDLADQGSDAGHPLPDRGPDAIAARHRALDAADARKYRAGSDDMMIVRGVNVFPTQIEELLLGVPALSGALPAHSEPRGPAGRTGGPGRGAIVVRIGRGARAWGRRARARDESRAHRRQRERDRRRAGRRSNVRSARRSASSTRGPRHDFGDWNPPRRRCAPPACPRQAAQEWSASLPGRTTGDYEADARRFGAFWRRSAALLQRLPHKAAAERSRTGGRGGAALSRPRFSRNRFSPPTSSRSTGA